MSIKQNVKAHKGDTGNGGLAVALAVACEKNNEDEEVASSINLGADSVEQSTLFFSPPDLDDEELARLKEEAKQESALNKEWLKAAGKSLFECNKHLKKTNRLKEKFIESRTSASNEIVRIKEEAKRRGINWVRVGNSAFIARINACPIPDTEKPDAIKRSISEMEWIVSYLTEHHHHRRKIDEEPEVSLYHFADWKDRAEIRQWQKERKKLPIGYRFYAGRHMVPNPDPVTGNKTAYQKAVERAFRDLLFKYDVVIKDVYRQEVKDLIDVGTEDSTGILQEIPGENYFVKNPNGLGALLVRGFYKEFKNREKLDEDAQKVFVVSVVKAVGIWHMLERINGFYIPIWCAKKGFIPKNTTKEKRSDVERFAKIMSRELTRVGQTT